MHRRFDPLVRPSLTIIMTVKYLERSLPYPYIHNPIRLPFPPHAHFTGLAHLHVAHANLTDNIVMYTVLDSWAH